MKNTPYKVIDPETGQEKVIWQSRSAASAIFVFTKDHLGNWFILANKRGQGTPDFQGCWNCPCGYLDFDENTREAAIRECREETGVQLYKHWLHLYSFNDEPTANRQNITFHYYAIINNGFAYNFSKKENEEDEVDDICWIPIEDLNAHKWAFNHNSKIMEIYNNRINISWWKKQILEQFMNYLSPLCLQ